MSSGQEQLTLLDKAEVKKIARSVAAIARGWWDEVRASVKQPLPPC